MTAKVQRISLKESLEVPSRAKLFPFKIQPHPKNNSVSITQSQNFSPKKIFLKGNKKTPSKASLIKFNPAYLEEIASYGTNDKDKENRENKEKDSMEKLTRDIERKRMTLFEFNNDKAKELIRARNQQKKQTRNKKM